MYQKIILILLICCFGFSLNAAEINWNNYTSFNNVRTLRVIDDTLYAATSGGLLTVTDISSIPEAYQNINGLGTNNLSDIIKDSDGQKWITGFGRLVKFNQSASRQYLFFDNDDNLFMLNTLKDDNDFLWIGSSIGLILFSKINDDGQIEDSYQLFGNLNPAPSINDILLDGDSIWLATSDGLAVGNRTDHAQLKSPSNWTTYNVTSDPILESNDFHSIVKYNSSLYAANDRAVFKIDIDLFGTASFIEIPISSTFSVNNLQVENDSLFVLYTSFGTGKVGVITNDNLTLLADVGQLFPQASASFDNVRWIGMRETGISTFDQGGVVDFQLSGLPHNNVSDITIDSEGTLYAGFDRVTYSQTNSNMWDDFNFWVGQDATVTMLDSLGQVWMGTWGTGVWLYDGDTVINYDENNSSLRGNSEGPWWVYTTGMDTDGRYLYFTSYRALNNYPIAIGDMENLNDPAGWDSIGVVNGLSNTFLTSLDYSHGKVAVGTESGGVYECFVGDDPFSSQKICRHLTKENSLLISNTIRAVKYSPEGDLWVGTNFGLSRYDPGVDFFRDVPLPSDLSSDITAMEFDGRGNLWIGTPNGLAKRNVNDGTVEIFNTINSGLVYNNIRNISFDNFTGNIYIATTGGISMIPSQQGKPVFSVEEVIAFPNPFLINSSTDILSFNFGRSGIVTIFNVGGERIRTIQVNQGWDGKNDLGSDVASGVYLFLIEDEEGNVGQGKILLVRN